MKIIRVLKKKFQKYIIRFSGTPRPIDLYRTYFLNDFEFAFTERYLREVLDLDESHLDFVEFHNHKVPLIDLQSSFLLDPNKSLTYKKVLILEIEDMFFGILFHTEGKRAASEIGNSVPVINAQTILNLVTRNEEKKTFITFCLDKTYAIQVEHISEMIPFPTVIKTSPHLSHLISGYFQLNDETFYIVNTKVFCNPRCEAEFISKDLLIIRKHDFTYALMMDSIEFFVIFPNDKLIKPEGFSKKENTQKIIVHSRNGDLRAIHLLNIDLIDRNLMMK